MCLWGGLPCIFLVSSFLSVASWRDTVPATLYGVVWACTVLRLGTIKYTFLNFLHALCSGKTFTSWRMTLWSMAFARWWHSLASASCSSGAWPRWQSSCWVWLLLLRRSPFLPKYGIQQDSTLPRITFWNGWANHNHSESRMPLIFHGSTHQKNCLKVLEVGKCLWTRDRFLYQSILAYLGTDSTKHCSLGDVTASLLQVIYP